ncbi:flagellar basal body L-ring protein FlgH [Plasticicumulans sp.]|uniref:flagellar basal body L-ring protein FlgH n=1 Tax=Plasticicumulans sp. TaxID=2307179 RepID=UPI002B810818|nr:flagellar basal body L-ring protein FlgH [Plasticicumulans sp.]HNM42053.1 flagellar basal body L-ring protein FlgH [Plasticicumulans sp.]
MNPCLRLGLVLVALLSTACTTLPLDHEFRPVMPTVMTTVPQARPRVADGSIYRAGTDLRLFESRTARRIGDVITIRLAERTNASKKADTKLDKSSNASVAAPAVLFGKVYPKAEIDLSSERDFEGSGSADQSNSITGTITAVVTEVYPNGNLQIRGEKKVTLNQGDEFVIVQGVVRPDDIAADNSIASGQVADAQITYAGKGAVADANTAGWLTRFLIHAFFPI